LDDYAEFRHLKYLLAIVKHKGVRAAAEALHIASARMA
jgi:DNA-binding transcriptional LysR family regulator